MKNIFTVKKMKKKRFLDDQTCQVGFGAHQGAVAVRAAD